MKRERQRRGTATIAALLFVPFVVVGCGGTEGDQIGIADGQSEDPVVVDVPIAYVKRALPLDEDGVLVTDDVREPITFNP